METIGQRKIWSYFGRQKTATVARNTLIRSATGHRVGSFMELATKIAELQFMNRDYVLLFRGQSADHRNVKNNTTLKPGLFRPGRSGGNPKPDELELRFNTLQGAEEELLRRYKAQKFLGVDRLTRHRILRWSILQHYEVCPTPLLDVTHSIRIAASFASVGAKTNAFVYVIGVPNLSGAITASAEGGLQIVRLSSACPPSAVRPHIQEGYLLGEYPELSNFQQKEHYAHYEIDFGRRLVAKFSFDPASFWRSKEFPRVSQQALYPSPADDPLYKVALEVKTSAEQELRSNAARSEAASKMSRQ
jgi:FRG domain